MNGLTENTQAKEQSAYPDMREALHAIAETERRLHEIRRNILRKLELRLSIENWCGTVRCQPPSTL